MRPESIKRWLWVYFLSLTAWCGGYLVGSIDGISSPASILWRVIAASAIIGAIGTGITVNIADAIEQEEKKKKGGQSDSKRKQGT